jgi:hypothetical protein
MANYAYTFTSGDTVTPTKLNNARTVSEIVNADVSATAAIAGTKIAPDFGSQNVVTTGESLVGHSSGITTSFAAGGTSGIPKLQVAGPNVANSSIGLFNYSNVGSSSGQVLLSRSTSNVTGSHVAVSSGNRLGEIGFIGSDGTNFVPAALIRGEVDGTPSTNDMPGRLVFSTTADGASSPTERMRITSSGELLVGTTTTTAAEASIHTTIASATRGAWSSEAGTTGGRLHMRFVNPNGVVGSISTSASATAFTTSSDYRLKQNVEPMTGGLSKLAALAPKTFEFKAEPSVKVDGFIAHEVAQVVPAAVVGEKDGEEMQGIDHSRLVPVLVAAVQELSAKVAALEAA